MQNQRDQFAAIFFNAYPFLNNEQRRMLEELTQLWVSQVSQKPDLRLVVGGSSSR